MTESLEKSFNGDDKGPRLGDLDLTEMEAVVTVGVFR